MGGPWGTCTKLEDNKSHALLHASLSPRRRHPLLPAATHCRHEGPPPRAPNPLFPRRCSSLLGLQPLHTPAAWNTTCSRVPSPILHVLSSLSDRDSLWEPYGRTVMGGIGNREGTLWTDYARPSASQHLRERELPPHYQIQMRCCWCHRQPLATTA